MAEINEEVQRACDEARLFNQEPDVSFDDRWEGVATVEDLTNQADTCVQAADEAEIASAQPVNVDEVIKDPDAVEGQVFILISEITQFDGATGSCAFRGYWDNNQQEYNFDYAGDNAFFTSGDGDSSCPALTDIDQNDVVRLWVKGAGTLDYETQIGGSTTAPAFYILKAEIIEKR